MKRIEFEDLKVGDRIYRINYFNFGGKSERVIKGLEVVKKNKESFRVKIILGEEFGNKIGDESRITRLRGSWFNSVSKCIKYAIETHKKQLEWYKLQIRVLPKEIEELYELI